jgi:antitoxin component of RelBE/YafQ-DinJ toxin-antitoxin module
MKEQKRASIYIRNLSPSVKTRFKAYCASKGMTMESAISAMIQKAIRADASGESVK